MSERDQACRIAMVLFPDLTQLDLTGPHEVLAAMPGAEIDLVWHCLEPVVASRGLSLTPTATFADYGAADVLFVPGGRGHVDAMEDEALLGFVSRIAEHARLITSVCTGSFVLAAAGLLRGRRATSHWASVDQLALFGAHPVKQRVVEDGPIITGAGVTSGIDFGLTVVARLHGEAEARRIQLQLEYDPAPPFEGGSIATADPAVVARIRQGNAERDKRRATIARRVAAGREPPPMPTA